VVPVAAVVVVIFGLVQWLRPLPSATFRAARTVSLRLPGDAPSLPWPTMGAATLTEVGVGSLGSSGTAQALPVASIAKVLTAYVVLEDHPTAVGASGPAIAVSPAVLSEYQSGVASQQSEVAVATGESLTELQALEGLLIASGNDMAVLLADWDAGSTSTFVARMNSTAKALGLSSTRITDPSGLDPATVSSAQDLVRLGQDAMAIPVFRQIVDMGEVTLPMAGLVYNVDADLGHAGIVGIKTGSDSAAGGCFLFEARQTVSGQTVTLVGAVLGQQGQSIITTALDDAENLVTAAFASMHEFPVVSPGRRVATVVAPWGASVPVTAPDAPEIVAAPGITLRADLRGSALGSSLVAGARVGTLTIVTPGGRFDVALRTADSLPGPSVIWRLTRL
jgi:serine-type D-Ala-D-Ala carboxypeptidase (penicillin-binding protein 5/6)